MDEASGSSKRRRGLGLVTPNACSECRKKRAKCDGKKPSCSRCEASGVTCQYEASVRQSKDSMRNELQQLHTYRQHSELVLRALAEDEAAADVLERIRSGEGLESIAIRLSTGSVHTERRLEFRPAYQTFDPFQAVFGHASSVSMMRTGQNTNFSNAFSSVPGGSEGPNLQYSLGNDMRFGWEGPQESPDSASVAESSVKWSPDSIALPQPGADAEWPIIGNWMPYPGRDFGVSQRDRGQEFLFGPDSMTQPEEVAQSFNLASWTSVTDDVELMDHLLALYFCWEYPTFASISKEHFLKDYRSGSQRFCSPLLVNAMLALGSRFSDAMEVRGDAKDGSTAGDRFYAEALRLLAINTPYSLPTVQAIGLLSIREASCGLDSDSWFHSGQSIRMACEMGLHRVRSERDGGAGTDMEEVQTATFWGAFALNIAWSMMTGRLPHLSRDVAFMGKPSADHRAAMISESIDWVPYTDDGMPLERHCTQTSNVRTIYKCFCELSEILHHALYILYGPGNNYITAARLVRIYTTLLNWYGSLPEALRLGKNFTPAVLFVHLYYHTSILHLFRPFIKTRLEGSTISPRDVCIQAADSISSLVQSYHQLYSLRRTPSFVPYIILTSTLTYVVVRTSLSEPGSTSLNSKLIQGITDLRDMSTCHGFARMALRILRFLSRKWDVKGLEETWGGENSEEKDVKEEGEGVTFSLSSLNHFAPDLHAYFENVSDVGSGFPLFSAFPVLGLPLLQAGLEEAGFHLLRDSDGQDDARMAGIN